MIYNPFHPGVFLLELMESHKISPERLASSIFVSEEQVRAVVDGEQVITPDLAKRLAKYFNTNEAYWMNLQTSYDLTQCKPDRLDEIRPISWIKPSLGWFGLNARPKKSA